MRICFTTHFIIWKGLRCCIKQLCSWELNIIKKTTKKRGCAYWCFLWLGFFPIPCVLLQPLFLRWWLQLSFPYADLLALLLPRYILTPVHYCLQPWLRIQLHGPPPVVSEMCSLGNLSFSSCHPPYLTVSLIKEEYNV